MQRFQNYQQWREHLPTDPEPEFIAFIQESKPLSERLRNQWLFKLAKEQKWDAFLQFYQPTDSSDLQCYHAWATYQKGDKAAALKLATPLWLVGRSQSAACDPLFSALIKDKQLDNRLIEQRITLALRVRNLPISRYLLKQLVPPRTSDSSLLIQIYQNPGHINQLSTAPLHDEFYLYGLKRMVSTNMDKAIQYWQHVRSKKLLNEAQQQAFLAHVALYKAMRHHEDAHSWFSKVKPEYYNDVLLEWQIRYALKKRQWQRVEALIQHMPDQDDPGLNYWRARAEEQNGKEQAATARYQKLATMRHYYGFLANTRLKKPFHFEKEASTHNLDTLKVYQPVLDKIEQYYKNNQMPAASRMVNDFASELPKHEQSALANWLADTLHWYGKSVYLANDNILHNQLDLRFPLAHADIIQTQLKNKELPEAFIYAIIRQESAFREQVVSPVGARGLMQLMPNTAAMIAQKSKIPYRSTQELFNTEKNITLGIAYLQHLHQRFNGHPVFMSAAYNAGPHQVERWLKDSPPAEMDIWIESIPFHETRNYLKNVMAFFAVYQYRLGNPAKLHYFLNEPTRENKS
ncbi:MAG: lytic transglycosylase domain-containing protein [Legionellaceae bacterium]|nr:lytic transglycosylase domain-containing protein [Legionellaceae bacterium]